jgi:WD40 repeat protein
MLLPLLVLVLAGCGRHPSPAPEPPASSAPAASPDEPRLNGNDTITVPTSTAYTPPPPSADMQKLMRVLAGVPAKAASLPGEINQFAISPGGDLFAVGTYRATFQVWSRADGAPINTVPGVSIAFAPGGRSYAAVVGAGPWDIGSAPTGLSVYSRDRGTRPVATLPGNFTSVRYSADGATLALSEDVDGGSRMVAYNVATGKSSPSPLLPIDSLLKDGGVTLPFPTQVSVTSDGKRLVGAVIAETSAAFFVWTIGSSTVDTVRCGCPAVSSTVDSQGRYVAFVVPGWRVSVWDTTTRSEVANWSQPPSASAGDPRPDPSAVGFSPDGRQVMAGQRKVYSFNVANSRTPVELTGFVAAQPIVGIYPYSDHEAAVWVLAGESVGVGGTFTAITY